MFVPADGISCTAFDREIRDALERLQVPQQDADPLALIPPFAVVASTAKMLIDGAEVPVRGYPWGNCVIDNVLHCDFTLFMCAHP